MERKQLEIRLECRSEARQRAPYRRRQTRARWWFDQMRRVVDDATEWNPDPGPDPGEPPKKIAA